MHENVLKITEKLKKPRQTCKSSWWSLKMFILILEDLIRIYIKDFEITCLKKFWCLSHLTGYSQCNAYLNVVKINQNKKKNTSNAQIRLTVNQRCPQIKLNDNRRWPSRGFDQNLSNILKLIIYKRFDIWRRRSL